MISGRSEYIPSNTSSPLSSASATFSEMAALPGVLPSKPQPTSSLSGPKTFDFYKSLHISRDDHENPKSQGASSDIDHCMQRDMDHIVHDLPQSTAQQQQQQQHKHVTQGNGKGKGFGNEITGLGRVPASLLTRQGRNPEEAVGGKVTGLGGEVTKDESSGVRGDAGGDRSGVREFDTFTHSQVRRQSQGSQGSQVVVGHTVREEDIGGVTGVLKTTTNQTIKADDDDVNDDVNDDDKDQQGVEANFRHAEKRSLHAVTLEPRPSAKLRSQQSALCRLSLPSQASTTVRQSPNSWITLVAASRHDHGLSRHLRPGRPVRLPGGYQLMRSKKKKRAKGRGKLKDRAKGQEEMRIHGVRLTRGRRTLRGCRLGNRITSLMFSCHCGVFPASQDGQRQLLLRLHRH